MRKDRPSGRFLGMRSIITALLAFLALVVSGAAFASGTVPSIPGQVQYACPASSGSAVIASSAMAACQAYFDAYDASASHGGDPALVIKSTITSCSTGGSGSCTGTQSSQTNYAGYPPGPLNYSNITANFVAQGTGPETCPANSTLGPGAGTCTCTDPAVAQGGQCVIPNKCTPEAGKKFTTNFTVGYARNPNYSPVDAPENIVGDYTGPKIGQTVCVAGCSRDVQGAPTSQGYASLQPASNGLYRLSLDFTTAGNGTVCTPGANDPSDPNAPVPPCPGTVGEVNGKPACLPKAGPNSPPLPTPSNPASAPPAGVPITSGNPAAGDAPTSGQGSGTGGAGRTPTSGSGGSGGGGSSAVGGGATSGSGTTGGGAAGGGSTVSGGSGTSTDPYRAKDPCGIPGSPACKIDETGTVTGQGAFDASNATLAQTKTDALAGVAGAASADGKDTTWGFSFSLPTGCTNFAMAAFSLTIDVCQFQPMIHDLMALVWLAVTVWTIIGMVGRTASGGA